MTAKTLDVYGPPAPVTEGAACRARLKAAGAEFVDADLREASSAAHAACVVSEPVRLRGVAVPLESGVDFIKFSAPPLLACDTALAVVDWVQQAIAPLARGHFGEPLTELSVGGGFECRQRNHQPSAPMSEHSFGRALDIMAFRIGTRVIKVEKTPAAAVQPFISAVWSSGCGRFATALGPNADAAHENHIHVDLQPRRSASSKFCE